MKKIIMLFLMLMGFNLFSGERVKFEYPDHLKLNSRFSRLAVDLLGNRETNSLSWKFFKFTDENNVQKFVLLATIQNQIMIENEESLSDFFHSHLVNDSDLQESLAKELGSKLDIQTDNSDFQEVMKNENGSEVRYLSKRVLATLSESQISFQANIDLFSEVEDKFQFFALTFIYPETQEESLNVFSQSIIDNISIEPQEEEIPLVEEVEEVVLVEDTEEAEEVVLAEEAEEIVLTENTEEAEETVLAEEAEETVLAEDTEEAEEAVLAEDAEGAKEAEEMHLVEESFIENTMMLNHKDFSF